MKSRHVLSLGFLASLFLLFSGSALRGQSVQAVNDTIDIVPGIPVTIDLLANDIYPAGDSVHVYCGAWSGIYYEHYTKGIYTFEVRYWGHNGTRLGQYWFADITTLDTSLVAAIIFRVRDYSYDSLTINNVSARFNAWGNHFHPSDSDFPGFTVPKGTLQSPVFCSALWIGGLDAGNNMHVAAERYRQGPFVATPGTKADFFAGPVMDSASYSEYQDTIWNYVWNLKRSDIEYHKAHWQDAGYIPIHDVVFWPGNANTALGQAPDLAPYYDNNGDGFYNPFNGDYPLIRGDQALWFIFNDDMNYHSETQGAKLGIEVHGMAYEFDLPSDSAFKNTVFLNYKIINRSTEIYHDAWLGIFTDFDIGYAEDDYVKSDVQRGSYIGYNGDPVDGSGQAWAYGAFPPAEAVTILGGPLKDPDGIDNPAKDNTGLQLCNESVNGLNFGDGVVDNERYGMTTFAYNHSINPPSQWDYFAYDRYYKFMQARWGDSTRFVYGGGGNASAGGYGPECNFLFPGWSDSLNWGVGCQPPNGPHNWTQSIAGIPPNEIRGIGSMGPFTFHPGEVNELDIAYIFARNYATVDSMPSVPKLEQMIDIIRGAYLSNTLPDGRSFNGITETGTGNEIQLVLSPNPSTGKIKIDFGKVIDEEVSIRVTDLNGRIVHQEVRIPRSEWLTLNLDHLDNGLYLLTLSSKLFVVSKKISILK